MRISVVTVCYNAAHTLADAVDSVLGQTSDPSAPFELEYIVVDGGSTDGTLDLLARHRNRIATLISEPDNGLYDAMNKGIKAATGDVVAILNADDVYASTDVLARVAATFRDSGVEAVCGDLNYVTADDLSKVTRRWNAGPYTPGAFRRGWMPPHPALFVRRTCYDRWGSSRWPFARPRTTNSCFASSTGMACHSPTSPRPSCSCGQVGSATPRSSTASAPTAKTGKHGA